MPYDPLDFWCNADGGELCLGPPCRHFPDWVKTPQDARDYLAYKILSTPTYVGVWRGMTFTKSEKPDAD